MEGLTLLLSLMSVLLAISFYVVVERKMLGLLQRRHGPNKTGVLGVVLPLVDGMKLVSKEVLRPFVTNVGLFVVGPMAMFIISFSAWLMYPVSGPFVYFKYGVLYYMCLMCINVFSLVLCGWGSGCSYGLLGSMRAAAQSISYELSLNTVIFCVLLAMGSLEFNEMQMKGPFCLIALLEVFIIWVISALAELNRIPFDFAEGESELVSGYMVEYGGILFVFVILSEYGSVIFTSVLTVVFFFIVLPVSGVPGNSVFVLVAVLISLVIIVLRGALPRYRYDKLMEFCWKVVLPISTGFFLLCIVAV